MTWIRLDKAAAEADPVGAASFKGYGRHEEVPREIVEEAEKLAKKAIEGDDEEEDKDKMQES